MSREEDHKRISALAGVDESGAILPPPEGMRLDQSPSPFWNVKAGQECPLRPRELEAIRLFADGYSGKQAAHAMGMSAGALGYVTSAACRALDASSKTHLVSIALRKGWIK